MAGITDQQKHSISINLKRSGSLIYRLATSPALTGNHLASPRHDKGDLKKTFIRYAGSSIESKGIESRQLNTSQHVS